MISVITLSVIVIGKSDNGFETPKNGYNKLAKNPINIEKVMLKPTENRTVSKVEISQSFRDLSKTKPGINVR